MATASEPTAEPPANPSSTPAFRAAQYVRMSTEHQQYSTHNQADKIQEYADRRNIQIVRTYADEGKSGLSVTVRATPPPPAEPATSEIDDVPEQPE